MTDETVIRQYGLYARDMHALGVRATFEMGAPEYTVRWDEQNDCAVFNLGERTLLVPDHALDEHGLMPVESGP